jgi:hypothetical protein
VERGRCEQAGELGARGGSDWLRRAEQARALWSVKGVGCEAGLLVKWSLMEGSGSGLVQYTVWESFAHASGLSSVDPCD